MRSKGTHFQAGELVWVHSPRRKKGAVPQVGLSWVGPCQVVERLGEVVYRVQLPRNRKTVALHRDRLAPYRGDSLPSQTPVGRDNGTCSHPSSPLPITHTFHCTGAWPPPPGRGVGVSHSSTATETETSAGPSQRLCVVPQDEGLC